MLRTILAVKLLLILLISRIVENKSIKSSALCWKFHLKFDVTRYKKWGVKHYQDWWYSNSFKWIKITTSRCRTIRIENTHFISGIIFVWNLWPNILNSTMTTFYKFHSKFQNWASLWFVGSISWKFVRLKKCLTSLWSEHQLEPWNQERTGRSCFNQSPITSFDTSRSAGAFVRSGSG